MLVLCSWPYCLGVVVKQGIHPQCLIMLSKETLRIRSLKKNNHVKSYLPFQRKIKAGYYVFFLSDYRSWVLLM